MTSPDDIMALLDRFTDALNDHDLDTVLALVTDDFVFESTSPAPDGVRYEGREAVRSAWGEILESTPHAHFTIEEQFVLAPDRAVVLWRYDWGDGHVRGVDVDRFRDGKMAENLAYVKG
jgi:ketosteroid isomerase-like protein